MSLENTRILDALSGKTPDATPVWVMRQAGRYLPEYRNLRAKAGSFLNLCQNPEFATEVTMQPLRRFELDAAILFSDILTIPDAMGLGLYFVEGEGPKFKYPLRDEKSIIKLELAEIDSKLDYVFNAVKMIKSALGNSLPLIGFSGSPWTLACYMIEGGASKDFGLVKKLRYQDPKLMAELLNKIANAVSDYLELQIINGCDVVQIFDTWGGVLSYDDYLHFSLNPMKKIIANLKSKFPNIPIILFTKGATPWLTNIANSGCDGVGLDWTINPKIARQAVGSKICLQGNLDPQALNASDETIKQMTKSMLADFGKTNHIANLGHGITPQINPDKLKCFIDAVHDG